MDDPHGTGIVALLIVIAACLTVFFLKIGQPTGALVEFFLPRM